MNRSTIRPALPGLALGALGLAAGILGLVADSAPIGFFAGALAMAAGLTGLVVTRQLDTQTRAHAMVENELRATLAKANEEATNPVEAKPSPSSVTPNPGSTPDPLPQAGPDAESGPPVDADRSPGSGTESDGGAGTAEKASDPGAQESDWASSALIDPQTGLFSQEFFQVALDSRIAAARRHLRPVAMALIDVVSGLPADEPRPVNATLIADTIKTTLREADTACRLESGYFALLLEDTPENGAIWTVERIRRQLAENQTGLTVWAGVACYPAHAFSPDKLLEAAEHALVAARDWRQDRIEIAAATE